MNEELERLAEAGGLRYATDAGIATITLNRPDRGNAMTGAMGRALKAAWAEVRDNPGIRVAVVTGAGERFFCTGADVGGLDAESELSGLSNRPFHEVNHFSPHQNRVWKPVVCAVNGLCNAGGLHFVVDSDIIVASRNAKFMDSHTNVGLVSGIESVGLMRRLPVGTALRLSLQGKNFRLTAERAHQLGLVDELAETPAEVLPLALAIARDIAANSPQAVTLTKQAMWNALETGYSQACEGGWNLVKLHWSHPDFQEGPKAFAEGRPPQWNPDPDAQGGAP